jgi:hypothetical protein
MTQLLSSKSLRRALSVMDELLQLPPAAAALRRNAPLA